MSNVDDRRKTRKQLHKLLETRFPMFKFIGIGGTSNGEWDTKEPVLLEKPYNGTAKRARFVIRLYAGTKYCQEVCITANVESLGWETMFNGYIESVDDIGRILNFQLGVPDKANPFTDTTTFQTTEIQ